MLPLNTLDQSLRASGMVESCPKESLKLFTVSTYFYCFLIFKPCFLIYVLSVFVYLTLAISHLGVTFESYCATICCCYAGQRVALPSQSSKCWDYSHVPPCSASYTGF